MKYPLQTDVSGSFHFICAFLAYVPTYEKGVNLCTLFYWAFLNKTCSYQVWFKLFNSFELKYIFSTFIGRPPLLSYQVLLVS